MFTGIVTALGTVRDVTAIGGGRDMRLVIGVEGRDAEGRDVEGRDVEGRDVEGWGDLRAVPQGASIACSGCCLTAVDRGADWFAVDASAETLSKTTLGGWRPGSRVNLERPLRVGDELGGHIVSGHVDGVGEVLSATPEHGSTRWRFRVPAPLARYIAPKGSIAIDGVSLTVNEVEGATFGVNIIPHTASVTTFGLLRPGDSVNIEIDTLARYVARLQETT